MASKLADKPAVDELYISEVEESQAGSTYPSISAFVGAAKKIKPSGVVESTVGVGKDFEITNVLQLDINLSRAVVAGRSALVEQLISRGANVNSENTYTSGPLHNAAISGNLDIMQILLANDADINAKALVGAYPGETALHAAAFGGHLQAAELLLANGADVNATDQHSYTPIRRAVVQGDKTMLDLLIKNGANITIIDQGGMTLLHVIAPSRHVAVAERLIAMGVDINAADNSGFTPLDYAKVGLSAMIEVLERHGGVCTTC